MNEAGDGDDQSPLARAQVQHGVLLQTVATRHRMLVLQDAVIDGIEIDRWHDSAAQQVSGGEGLKIVLAQARLDLVERLDSGGRGLRAQPAVTRDFGFAQRGAQWIEIHRSDACTRTVRSEWGAVEARGSFRGFVGVPGKEDRLEVERAKLFVVQ